jgi:F-type H+-transporting ATPase subunit alpha
MLKQPQYSPVSVEKQVAIIHLGTNNLMKDVAVNKVQDFEKFFLSEVERQHPEVLANFRAKKFENADLAILDQLAAQLAPQFA